jgi:uncharacterized protein (UPF0212 family)
MTKLIAKPETKTELTASVYCPICTHTVQAKVLAGRRGSVVKPGELCPRCNSKLDAAFVIATPKAA